MVRRRYVPALLRFLLLPNIFNFGCGPKSTRRPGAAMWPRNSAGFGVAEYFKFRMWPEIDPSTRRRYVAPELCWFSMSPGIFNFGRGPNRPIEPPPLFSVPVTDSPEFCSFRRDAFSFSDLAQHRPTDSSTIRGPAILLFFGVPRNLNFGCGPKSTHRPVAATWHQYSFVFRRCGIF